MSHYEEREVSVGEAVKAVPFSLITGDEFKLAWEIAEDPSIRAISEDVGSERRVLPSDHIAQYRDLLRIDGEPASSTEVLVTANGIILDYSAGYRRCILEVYWDGTVRKTSVCYSGDGTIGTKGPVVQCEDNEHFQIGRIVNGELRG